MIAGSCSARRIGKITQASVIAGLRLKCVCGILQAEDIEDSLLCCERIGVCVWCVKVFGHGNLIAVAIIIIIIIT